ncbi:MAG: hypothetical protein NW203_05160 [Hyphomonadaceae bacterium]|nr:hypothetical protein [Hyphomonadaceae bacterium]
MTDFWRGLEAAARPLAGLLERAQENPVWVVGGFVVGGVAWALKFFADRRKAAQERQRYIEAEADKSAAEVREANRDRLAGSQLAETKGMQQHLQALAAQVAAEKGVPLPTMTAILEAFGEQAQTLDANALIERLTAKAVEYQDLAARLATFSNADPAVATLRGEARDAIIVGDFVGADALLRRAERIDRMAVEDMESAALARRSSAAQSLAERAALASLRSAQREAATLFAEAAEMAPSNDLAQRLRYRVAQADALRLHGETFLDNDALREAIAIMRSAAAELAPRDRDPAGWAMTQVNLGNALARLGERGDDAALADSVQAFRAALEVLTRDRDPAGWAVTQMNLGNALRVLGERGDDAALADGVQAYRAALEIRTRDRDPAGWAKTQVNLGTALLRLDERGDDAALADGVQAFRAALEVLTRDRDLAG